MCAWDPSCVLFIPCFYTLSWCLQPSIGFIKRNKYKGGKREEIQNMNSTQVSYYIVHSQTLPQTDEKLMRSCREQLQKKKTKRFGGKTRFLLFMHWEFYRAFSDRFLSPWASVHLRAGLYLKPCSVSVVRFDPNGSWSPSAAIRKRERNDITHDPKHITLYTQLHQ